MKRICIYVIYDKQKKVNAYIEPVLKELKKYTTDIVVICNFNEIVSGEEYVKPYAKEIYCRDNIGLDAGAYKDAIINLITWERALLYDELLLTNDTYFAPIYPFDDMFRLMQKKKCDFWGITRRPEGNVEGIGKIDAHIQSYFLCFKYDAFHSDCFKTYWENYIYTNDKESTIVGFELGLNKYLSANGYLGDSYMDNSERLSVCVENINPYSRFAYELIKEAKIPIIKKTNFYCKNRWLLNTFEAMDYIEKSTDYDVSLINNYVSEYQKKGLLGTYYDFSEMEKFVRSHSKIYIYGQGIWGGITAGYFERMGWKHEGFVITEGNSEETVRFDDIKVNINDGVIIAQEYKDVCDEIINYIGSRCKKDQLFTPCYPQ